MSLALHGAKAANLQLIQFIRWRYLFASLASVLLGCVPAAAATIFVDWQNSGVQDGTADHPYRTLPQGLTPAAPGDTIIIRAGSYSVGPEGVTLNKAIIVRSEGGTTLINATPLPLDLVADRGFDLNGNPFDLNGIALNPRWGYQTSPNQISHPQRLCSPIFAPFPRVNPSCTSQSPAYDEPADWSANLFWCSQAPGLAGGHSNWFPATYTGLILWGEKSKAVTDDDDYTMDLETPDARGVFEGDGGHVHLEFSSDETIDNFTTAWWSDFHEAVNRSNADAASRINNHPAIATGLMGIDWAHNPGAESHPVWALAIQNTAGWAFFVRNWGDEGYCSTQQHFLDALPGAAYKFKLPWEYGLGARGQKIPATDVSILPAEIHSEGIRFPQVNIWKVDQEGVLVAFQLPPPPLPGESGGRSMRARST